MAVALEPADGIVRIRLERPPVNALDLDMILALERIFRSLDQTAPVVITGSAGAFSAGEDTKAFAEGDASYKRELILAITRMTAAALALPVPLVAAVNGHALGSGLVLALCADYRIAVDGQGARFGLTEARAGIAFPAGPLAIIGHELPPAMLRQLTLSSLTVTSSDLYILRVFDEVMPLEPLLERADTVARDMMTQPVFTVVKRQMRGALVDHVAALAHMDDDPLLEALGL